MDAEWIRTYCMGLPGATEIFQWEALVFKVAGKIFAMLKLESSSVSLKCTPEEFAELVEREGISQAPYFAKNQWVSIESAEVVTRKELKQLVNRSYELIVAKLPKKTQAGLK